MIRNEIKRSICSKAFLFALAIMTLFAALSALYYIESWSGYNPEELNHYVDAEGNSKYSPDFAIMSLFSAWLGGDMLSLACTVFFTMIPIGAAIPFAWSYHVERKCGYLKNIVTRTERKKYLFAKTCAVFLSGAAVILIPYIINILMVSAYIPYYMPWAGYNFYNVVYFGTMWADLFFTHPFLHMFLFVMLNTLYGGIYALIGYAISFYIKNLFAVLFMPFVVTLAVGYAENVLFLRLRSTVTPYEIDPTKFLHSRSIQFFQNSKVILFITIALVVFALGTVFIKGTKDEIY